MRPSERGKLTGERTGKPLTGAIAVMVFLVLDGIWFAASEETAFAGQAIKVGEEVPLMTDGPGGGRRGKAAVAFGKDSFVVAWQEGWHGVGGSSRIFALRVGLDAKPLDAKPVKVASCKTGVQENPRIAFFEDTFLVVWQDMRNGRDCDVLGARISAEGKVLDKKPISIAAGPRTQAMPDVAADDKGFMVVWHAFSGKETIAKVFTRRVKADGTTGEPVLVPPARAYRTKSGASPRIAWNGKQHLVVYFGKRVLLWQRMDTAGKPLPTEMPRYPVRGGDDTPWQCSASALPSGKGWVIAIHGSPPNYWGRTVGTQRIINITEEGKKGIAATLDTSKGKKRLWPYDCSDVAADKQCCVAVWQRYHIGGSGQARMDLMNGDILAARADGEKVLDAAGVPVAASEADELDPAVAGNGAGKLLCVYEKVVDGKSRICARALETR